MTENRVIVFFHLQTTGLHSQCEIVQLSAVNKRRVFNTFSWPEYGIKPSVSRINGFTIQNDELYRDGQRKSTKYVYETLLSFIGFLRNFNRPVLLAAHNAKAFDARVLTRVLRQHDLFNSFKSVVPEYLDILRMARSLYPYQPSHSQRNLVDNFLEYSYDEYNALEDARALEDLFNYWSPSKMDIDSFIYPF